MNLSTDKPHGVRLFRSFDDILKLCPDEQTKRWYLAPYESHDTPVIIGGCGRSGTSLLRSIINAHPNFYCGPETALMVPRAGNKEILIRKYSWLLEIHPHAIREIWDVPSQAMFVDLLFATLCTAKNKRRWAEKTPKNVMVFDWILGHWPLAYLVHIIRDGRDVIASLREHPKWNISKGQRIPSNVHQPIEPCIERWIIETTAGLKWRGHPRYIELRYEDLVADPEVRLQLFFRQIGDEFHPCVLDPANRRADPDRDPQGLNTDQPIQAHSVGRWQRDLTKEELALIYSTPARQLLIDLGYYIDT